MPTHTLVLRIARSATGAPAQVVRSPEGTSDPVPCEISVGAEDLEEVARAVLAGHHRSPLRHLLPFGEKELPRDLLRVGHQLSEALFRGSVATILSRNLGGAGGTRESPLRIEIRIDPTLPEAARLQALPWELLIAPDERRPLALSPWTPVVRYLEVPRPEGRPPCPETLRILVVAPRPVGVEPLGLGRELADLRAAWSGEDAVELAVLEPPTLGGLRDELSRRPAHGLHFMGHGRFDREEGSGALLFEDDSGRADPVAAELLAEQVEPFVRNHLRIVVLNACQSARGGPGGRRLGAATGVAAALVEAGVPAVVAMQLPVSDGAAREISRQLYRSLAAGAPVDAAVAEARAAIRRTLRGSSEWMTPALFLRAEDGHLFVPRPEPVAESPEVPRPAPSAGWWRRIGGAVVVLIVAGTLTLAGLRGLLQPAGPERTTPPTDVGEAQTDGSAGGNQPPRGGDATGGAEIPSAPGGTGEEPGEHRPVAVAAPAFSTVGDGASMDSPDLGATLSVDFLRVDGEEIARVTVATDAGGLDRKPVVGPESFDAHVGERTIRVQVIAVDFDRRTVTLRALDGD